jgi:broad specificity phosphatase PhoE
MTLTLYLLRHGETTYSQTGGYCGDLDPALTTAGEEMARSVAVAYKQIEWSGVYVSPKQRAIATAKPLCDAVGVTMELRSGLQEIGYGKWEDRTNAQVIAEYPEDYQHWLAEPSWNPPTGGETGVEVATRANQVISEIQHVHPTGNILVVSHKATIRILLCSFLGIDLGRYRDRLEIPTASMSKIEFAKYGPRLLSAGDRSHLSLELRSRPGT